MAKYNGALVQLKIFCRPRGDSSQWDIIATHFNYNNYRHHHDAVWRDGVPIQ